MLELGTGVGFLSLVDLSTGCDMEPVPGLSEDSFVRGVEFHLKIILLLLLFCFVFWDRTV